ncbi:MAG TPA: glycosyltransferase [Mobilitalea sp.]|nr:glycosyltransferase [Mobilitalea sp.]
MSSYKAERIDAMNIVIMTGKFGMGHYVAAQAIKQQIELSNIEANVEVIDWFQYLSPKHADKFYHLFTVIVSKGCKLYNKRYVFLENRKTNQKPELSRYFLVHFARFIEDKKPDMIITTLPFCSQITSLYKERHNIAFPLITCVTDISGHSEWISKNTDFYLVGSHSVKERFIKKGVRPEVIFETGIPVRVEFEHIFSQITNTDLKHNRRALIMGGGLGILPENEHFYEGLNNLKDCEITVITGKNERLYQRMKGKYDRLKILGYVSNVYDYMRGADIIVSKPGGITIFEAIHAEIPILALNPCLQQEINNAKYIQEMQIGSVTCGSSKQCLEAIVQFLYSDKLSDYQMKQRLLKEHLMDNNISQIIENVMKDYGLLSADVINKKQKYEECVTIEALKRTLPVLKEEGYEFVTLDELYKD